MFQPLAEFGRRFIALVAMAGLLFPTVLLGQQSQTGYTFKAQTELVLVNVTVRDKSGNPVRDLKPEDFTVLEDNKPQKVATFDIENTQNTPQVPMQQANLLSTPAKKTKASAADAPAASAQESSIKDRRLIILFFDLSAMQPDEIERSANAAQDYLNKQMEPADLVSIVSLGNTITVNQDFTSDRDKLRAVLCSRSTWAQMPDSNWDRRALPKERPTPGDLSRLTTRNTTSSTPTGDCRRCARSPNRWRTFRRRSR